MNNLLRTQKGFTLIGMIIGLAIIVLVMEGIVQLMAISVRTEADASNKEACVQAVRGSLTIISEQIENADVISTPLTGATASNITYTIDGVVRTIDTEDNYIRITRGTDVQRFRATGIQPLTFTRDGANPRRVIITISAQNSDSNYRLQTSVVALNDIGG